MKSVQIACLAASRGDMDIEAVVGARGVVRDDSVLGAGDPFPFINRNRGNKMLLELINKYISTVRT